MNEEELNILHTLIEKTSELYDLYIKLKDLDDQKDTSFQLDVINDINLKSEEIDEFLLDIQNDKKFMNNIKEFLKQINPNVDMDNIFVVFNNKTYLVTKRLYDCINNIEMNNYKSFENNLKGYFKVKAKEKVDYSAYLFAAFSSYELEILFRTTEFLEETNLKDIKYILAFLNSSFDDVLQDTNYASVTHYFAQNTILDSNANVSLEVKQEFKNAYGCILLDKIINIIKKVKNEKTIEYLKNLIRSTLLFIDDEVIKEVLNSLPKDIKDLIIEIKKTRNEDLKKANQFETTLSKNTMDIIKQILDLTSNIKNIYNSLAILANDENSIQYKHMVECLEMNLEEETHLYEYFSYVDDEEKVKACKYLIELMEKKNFYDNADADSISNNEDELIVLRVFKKLYAIALDNDDYFTDNINEKYQVLASSQDDFDFVKYTMKNYDKIFNYLTYCFLQDQDIKIDNAYKYDMLFLNELLENEFVNGKFDNVRLRDCYRFIKTSFNEADLFLVQTVNNDYALDKLSFFIDKFLGYDDIDLTGVDIDDEDNELLTRNIEELAEYENENYEDDNEENEEEEEDILFQYNILISELKTCLLFVNSDGVNKIRHLFKLREPKNNKYQRVLFEQIYSIIDSYEKIQLEANKDYIKQSPKQL